MKAKAKEYNAQKKRVKTETGNNAAKEFEINQLLEDVVELTGTSHNNGLPFVSEVGLNRTVNSKYF